ncbi:MAG: MBL fold metallo-hydrolase [Thermomicrobiales bacterium]
MSSDFEQISDELFRASVPNLVGRIGQPTNVYFVGRRHGLLVDAGSDDGGVAVTEAIEHFGIDPPEKVILTHAHQDHAGAAMAIQQATGAERYLHPDATSTDVTGAQPLSAGQLFEAGPYRLTVIETPGHAVGHISLYEPGLKALFAGDLLSGFGTISIVPPAGSMRDYMASLHRVNEFEIDIIYPGHGPAIINGNERIDQYIERRESREREIFDAVASGLDTSEAVTALIYPEVQPNIQRAAEGTVRAHLIHLAEQGRIRVLDAGGGHPRYVACQKP